MAQTAVISNIAEALQELGVNQNTLSEAEKLALDEQGYVILRDVVDPKWLKELRDIFERGVAENRENNTYHKKKELNIRHIELKSIEDEDKAIERIYTHPKLLAAVHYILKDEFKIFSLSGRDPLPGFGQQGLHADWPPRPKGSAYQVVNSLWMLDDFTADNGATRLVPGTHKLPHQISKQMAQPESRHPEQVFAIAPAGSVLIFNAHLWHSGMRNNSQKSRRVINCFFSLRELGLVADTEQAPKTAFTSAVEYIRGR